MLHSTPVAHEAPRWEIQGTVPRAKISLQYRVATALVAVAMVLLPLVYIAVIASLGWWWWDFASAGPATPAYGKSASGFLFTYLTPLVIGAIVLVFMVKPLFHRRPKSAEPHRLTREQEPQLFDFIDRICDLVHAPRPHRVQVDLQVNASASLTHGMWSILSRRLTLSIGLPLAGGLNIREFGGVLAHEFGHFAQGAGMGTTYLVRMISMWFARVVYERDQWDAALETWARGSDWRLMLVLQFARLMVWLVRRILWVLMIIGSFFSAVLLRQMEFDADHYEIQTSGTEGFIATARRLRVLGLGAHVANNKQEEAFNAKRLVDNIPGWIVHEANKLPAETCEKVIAAAHSEKTGWLDTHPSDAERIQRAQAAHSSGILTGEAPAGALFSDFANLSRQITADVYRDLADAIRRTVVILPLEQMTAESDAQSRGGDAIQRMFHGLLTPRTMVFVHPTDLTPGSDDPRTANLAARQAPPDSAAATEKELDQAIERQNELYNLMGFLEASIPFNAATHKLTAATPSAVKLESTRTTQNIEAASAAAAPVLAQARQRIVAALQWKYPRASTALQQELLLLTDILLRIERSAPTLALMRPATMAMIAVLNHLGQSTDNAAAFRAVNSRAERLRDDNERLIDHIGDVLYPFEHAGTAVKLREFLTDSVSHSDGMILALMRANAIQDRLLTVYARTIGRLCLLTFEAESEMDAEPAPASAVA